LALIDVTIIYSLARLLVVISQGFRCIRKIAKSDC